MFCSFQFTPLREGRRDGAQVLRLRQISIHAPPRGATPTAAAYGARSTGFQFTPLREGRLIRISFVVESSLFQFTPLREGRREQHAAETKELKISIHAPPRGATSYRRHYRGVDEFQFTPLREGRPKRTGKADSDMQYFNSRPSARGDYSAVSPFRMLIDFNSRPSARGDEVPNNECI